MKFTLLFTAFLICRTCSVEGIIHQTHNSESLNRFNRGAQTFDYIPWTNDSDPESSQDATTTVKPLPPTYTVVDWKRYYPFGDKFPDSNHTIAANATDAEPTDPPQKPPSPSENQIVYPVYIKVPIRVPVKSPYRKQEISAPKLVMPRTVRGAKSLVYPYRIKIPPRYMMVRHLPMRRKFVTYYKKYRPYMRYPSYVKPVYHKTGIHDLYKNDVYYPLRGQGYEVTESPKNWYHLGKVNTVSNYL